MAIHAIEALASIVKITKEGRLVRTKLPSFLSKKEKINRETSDVLTKNAKYIKINATNIRRLMYKKRNIFRTWI